MKVIFKPLSELHVMEKETFRRHPEKQVKEYIPLTGKCSGESNRLSLMKPG